MATATVTAVKAATSKSSTGEGLMGRTPRKRVAASYRDALRVGWAVRNRAGQVVVIYEGITAEVAAQEWAADRDYTVEAVTL